MIIDCHTHIVSRNVRENIGTYAENDPEFGPKFGLIYGKKKARLVGAEELIASMDEAQIDKAVTCTYPWSVHELCVEGNDYILESVTKYPERLIGFCVVQPKAGAAAIYEIERCMARGMKGVGELSPYHQGIRFEEKELWNPIVEVIQKQGVPLLFHTDEPAGHEYQAKGETDIRQLYRFIATFSGISIILAHWGGGFFVYELMPDVKEEARSVYYDMANSPLTYSSRVISVAVDIVGANKILFGTDYPLLDQRRYLSELADCGLSHDDTQKILSRNIELLLQL